MIGLDTNILVRFFAQDDPIQSHHSDEIIGSLSLDQPGWIGVAMVLELAWMMTRIYRVDQPGMVRILDILLSRPEFAIEQPEVMNDAVARYRRGKTQFADCLIAASARAAGCSRTVTFDRIAARDAGMELLT